MSATERDREAAIVPADLPGFVARCRTEAILRLARGGPDDELFSKLYGTMAALAKALSTARRDGRLEGVRAALDFAWAETERGMSLAGADRDEIADTKFALGSFDETAARIVDEIEKGAVQ
jgi:hypothetical protein